MGRDKSIPLFIWMRNIGKIDDILKMKETGRIPVYIPKWKPLHKKTHTFAQVLKRFMRIYNNKVKVSQFENIFNNILDRYEVRYFDLDRSCVNQKTWQSILYRKDMYVQDSTINVQKNFGMFESDIYFALTKQSIGDQIPYSWEYQDEIKKYDKSDEIYNKKEYIYRTINEADKSWYMLNKNTLNREKTKLPKQIRRLKNVHEVLTYPQSVYFLTYNNQVVYVGQSVNPINRIAQHKKDKKFDRAFIKPASDLLKVESKFINKFKPLYNKMGKKLNQYH